MILTYITSRGPWYKYSWKGDPHKSGGIATNIGIHFFDLLIWLFEKVEKSEVHLSEENKMAGFLQLEQANLSGETLVQTDVKWFLSIDKNDLAKLNLTSKSQFTGHRPPIPVLSSNEGTDNVLRTFRSIKIDSKEVEFTDGFTDLHTKVYEKTIAGEGFEIKDVRDSIELVYKIKNAKLIFKNKTLLDEAHPFKS